MARFTARSTFHNGLIFKMKADGTDYTVLYQLPGVPYLLLTGPDPGIYGIYSGLGQNPTYTLFVLDLKGPTTPNCWWEALHIPWSVITTGQSME
jgi:hypothetical protein